jgi:DNA-binding IscR family transcriptional regulator
MPHADGACNHEGQCVLLAFWAEVGEKMRDHLSSFTLADMVSKAEGNGAKVPTVPDDLPVGVSRGMARSSAR